MTEQTQPNQCNEDITECGIKTVEDFGSFMTRWHDLCTTKLSTIIAAKDMRIMLQEPDGTQVEANKDTAYGFVRGLMYALEVFELPFTVVEVEPVKETVH